MGASLLRRFVQTLSHQSEYEPQRLWDCDEFADGRYCGDHNELRLKARSHLDYQRLEIPQPTPRSAQCQGIIDAEGEYHDVRPFCLHPGEKRSGGTLGYQAIEAGNLPTNHALQPLTQRRGDLPRKGFAVV